MKKLLCLFLAIVMLLGLCGCFDGGTDDIRGEINAEPTPNEPEFSLGATSGNSYTNDFLGLSCVLPAGWVFYTDEQIMELNNIAKDMIDDEQVSDLLKNATIVYDMTASHPDGSSININMEKLNAVQQLTLNLKSMLEGQISTIVSTYQNMGFTDVNVEYQKIMVDGKEFDGLKLTAKIQGIAYYGELLAFKRGSYVANVSIGSIQTDKSEIIWSCFEVE